MGLFDFGHDVIYVHVYNEGFDVYKSLDGYQKHNIKLLVLEKLYELTHNEMVKQEIEYEKDNDIKDRSSSTKPGKNIFFYVHYPVAVIYRGLDKKNKYIIALTVLEKLYELSEDDDLLKRIKAVKKKIKGLEELINPSINNK